MCWQLEEAVIGETGDVCLKVVSGRADVALCRPISQRFPGTWCTVWQGFELHRGVHPMASLEFIVSGWRFSLFRSLQWSHEWEIITVPHLHWDRVGPLAPVNKLFSDKVPVAVLLLLSLRSPGALATLWLPSQKLNCKDHFGQISLAFLTSLLSRPI